MSRIVQVLICLIVTAGMAIGQTSRSDESEKEKRGAEQARTSGMAVIQVFYYARPGKAEEVLSLRQHASDVLAKLGLPRGRVMRRVGGSAEDPDVLWECEFPSAAALDQFLKTAEANPEFGEVRKQMGTLIRKGERRDWEPQESSGSGR